MYLLPILTLNRSSSVIQGGILRCLALIRVFTLGFLPTQQLRHFAPWRFYFKCASISSQGVDFLKVATAAPDFATTSCNGIPDGTGERTFVLHSELQVPYSVKAGSTAVIVIPPAGGIAYYDISFPTVAGQSWPYSVGGVAILKGTLFPETTQVFPASGTSAPGFNTNQITQGRVMGMSAELVSTNNAFNQFGTILAFKTDITEASLPITPAVGLYNRYLAGVLPITSDVASAGSYLAPVKDGAYSVSMSRTAGTMNFPWTKVDDQVNKGTTILGIYDDPAGVLSDMAFAGPLVFYDNSYDTIIFRITVPTGVADQGFILKTWRSIEWSPVYNSLLYTIAMQGARRNEPSMKLYGEMARALPTSVPAKQNPDFWNTILDAVSDVSSVAGLIPGLGPVASGVHSIAGALRKPDKAPKAVNPDMPKKDKSHKTKKLVVKIKKKKKHK